VPTYLCVLDKNQEAGQKIDPSSDRKGHI